MEEIIKKLVEIEDRLDFARKMVDWGEYEHDHAGFESARLAIWDAIAEVSSIRKSLKSRVTEQA